MKAFIGLWGGATFTSNSIFVEFKDNSNVSSTLYRSYQNMAVKCGDQILPNVLGNGFVLPPARFGTNFIQHR